MKKINDLKCVLKSRQTKRFYVCKSCEIEVSEEKALEHGFTCEECAEVYELSNNNGPIRDTKAKITRIEKNLVLIQNELELVRNKKAKKRARANKKAEKEEIERKALMKIARAAARKKIAAAKKKTTGKKLSVKKKVAKKKIKKVAKKSAIKKKGIKKKVEKKTPVKRKRNLAAKLKRKLSKKK